MKKNRKKDEFLNNLREIPIVQSACKKTGLSRNTVYRWKNTDKKFKAAMEQALLEGEELINDLTEHQLLGLIQSGAWPAINFWLRHRNPKFKEKVEVNATISNQSEKLLPHEEKLVEEAIKRLSA